MDVQITRNQQEGFAEETGAIRSMLEKDDLSIQSIRVTIVGETGSRKAARQSWEAVQEPPRSGVWDESEACHGRVLPGGLRGRWRGLCGGPQLSIGLLAPL